MQAPMVDYEQLAYQREQEERRKQEAEQARREERDKMPKKIDKQLKKAVKKNPQLKGKWVNEKDIDLELEPIIKRVDQNNILKPKE